MSHQSIIPIYQTFSENILQHSSFLLLTDIEKTPPHCSLICNRFWFSLNHNECKCNIPFEKLISTLFKKNIPAIFLELNTNISIDIAEKYFSAYNKVNFKNQITCISPIKEIFIYYQLPVNSSMLLFEMIDVLFSNKIILSTYALNYSEKNYALKHYTISNLLEQY
ncbi:MAG: hypothetical protein OHK0036_14440 [Bacteroidia bacterium]